MGILVSLLVSVSAFGADVLKVATVTGSLEVRIVKETSCEGRIAASKVFSFDCDSAYLPKSLGAFKLKSREYDQVVILQELPMGNACNGGPLHLYGFRAGAAVVTIGVLDFCGGKDPVITASADKISVLFPGGAPNRGSGVLPDEKWLLAGGKLVKGK